MPYIQISFHCVGLRLWSDCKWEKLGYNLPIWYEQQLWSAKFESITGALLGNIIKVKKYRVEHYEDANVVSIYKVSPTSHQTDDCCTVE